MTKTSLLVLILSALLFIPIAEAKTGKVPNAKPAKTAKGAVPLEKFKVDWDDMPPKQKKLIRDSFCGGNENFNDVSCFSADATFYFFDLNDDGIKDLIWEEYGGSQHCYSLQVYMGTKTGYDPQTEIPIHLDFDISSCQFGYDPETKLDNDRMFYEAQDKAYFVLNSKRHGMRDLLRIIVQRNGMNVYTSSKILKYTWWEKNDGAKYPVYF